MRRHKKVVVIACIVGTVLMSFLCYLYFPWVLLPIESSKNKLTLVISGSRTISRISLRHYVNNVHISDYILDLIIGLRNNSPQTYDLPQLYEGMVEVIVEIVDGIGRYNRSFTTNYEKAQDLYEKGLLIYLADDYTSHSTKDGVVYYDRYIYFISETDETCYFEKAGSIEWSIAADAIPPQRFVRKDKTYSPLYYGWKENVWVVNWILEEY